MRGVPVRHKKVRPWHVSDLALAGSYGIEEREHVLLIHSRTHPDGRTNGGTL